MNTRPSPEQLRAAYGRSVPDLAAPGLRVLFVGINPSLWSAVTGHHFGNPNNRLWPVLHKAGFTSRRLLPEEAGELLQRGCGITNFVNRATATAAELTADELRAGGRTVAATAARLRPEIVAFLGLTAYRTAYGRPRAAVGPQDEPLESVSAWLLPNPSGLNAHYQMPELVRLYRELRRALA